MTAVNLTAIRAGLDRAGLLEKTSPHSIGLQDKLRLIDLPQVIDVAIASDTILREHVRSTLTDRAMIDLLSDDLLHRAVREYAKRMAAKLGWQWDVQPDALDKVFVATCSIATVNAEGEALLEEDGSPMLMPIGEVFLGVDGIYRYDVRARGYEAALAILDGARLIHEKLQLRQARAEARGDPYPDATGHP